MMTHSRARYAHRDGFTLVEMAIVIAIIGLLMGAIMSGQYMIKQSELQSVMADFNKYKGAFLQFRQQYGGPPGDLVDAEDYWGRDNSGTCPSGDTSYKVATCNGDGDGLLDLNGNGLNSTSDRAEIWRAWQHLSNAGFITGSFSGAVGSAGTLDSVPNENVPSGRRTGTGYSLFWIPTISSSNNTTYNNFYAGDYGTMVEFGLRSSADVTNGAALTSREAMRLDTKYDDGMPAAGRLFINRLTSTTCASTQTYTTTTATYTPSTSSLPNCTMNFLIDR